ncbi:2,3-bisphosphoglycerate-independent phosphoglycerate mutase [Patescibacteria group bacterium]|nr:2,3-bisphosphoglycerate-independent phosphoglycerate mutase [Patescibacteria group bacterium]
MSNQIQPVLLIILDGFGVASVGNGNAVTSANLPSLEGLVNNYPTTTLQASGESVGLSWGEPGNSEVGHLNMGGGRIIWQSLPRITQAISDNSFFKNKAFLKAVEHAQKNNSALHLAGLVSSGGVHSSFGHLHALLELAAQQGLEKVYLHIFLDGRDSPRDSGQGFVEDLISKMRKLGVGQIATLSGRFYAMDRDNNWDRIERAYLAMTKGLAEEEFEDPLVAIESSYQKGIYDEEFVPVVIKEKDQEPIAVQDNDALIFFNFRPDRARQITEAFTKKEFDGFPREKLNNFLMVTLTEYEQGLPVEIAFPVEDIKNPLAETISSAGHGQFHIAETEKYAHVTFFFNGRREKNFPQEERILIPSPQVSSYDQKPEMSAPQVTHQVLWALGDKKYKFIVVNFANPDMVGHTGNLGAVIKSLETLDGLVGKIVDLALKQNWVSIITADHGNCEKMINLRSGEINKEHTNNPVPFLVIKKGVEDRGFSGGLKNLSALTPSGVLADVAPTILKIMNLPQPPEMQGISLV